MAKTLVNCGKQSGVWELPVSSQKSSMSRNKRRELRNDGGVPDGVAMMLRFPGDLGSELEIIVSGLFVHKGW